AVVVPGVKVPANIQQFYTIPYPFNTSTAIGPLYQAAGVPGIIVFCFAFGVSAARVFKRWEATYSPATRVLCALVILAVLLSTGDLLLTNLDTVVQIGLLCWTMSYENRHTRDGTAHRNVLAKPKHA
ncbi:MAG: hypothetical protein M3256_25195, partial [Actinomycetota bacterium]|nr:hypothetical protein [Actinomycetota bacterium]